jgi:serine/threonine-protein kinase RsbT
VTREATIRVVVHEEPDVAVARLRARALALEQGLSGAAAAAVATAVSEVARNIVVHAGCGEVLLAVARRAGRRGVTVVARDAHPGIPDVEAALRDGWSSTGSLGLGLPGARRLMDEFELSSAPGAGTTVTMTKWAHGGDD